MHLLILAYEATRSSPSSTRFKVRLCYFLLIFGGITERNRLLQQSPLLLSL